MPGPADGNFDPTLSWPITLASAVLIEQVAYDCTLAFGAKLRIQNIAATVKQYLIGTHSWHQRTSEMDPEWAELMSIVSGVCMA
ncbi:hypothetical protein [Nocardia sp. NPDC049149]|uniref:hypothetical protein n=1 Tax=Nocardia sp. NPDC049149 TaxID=3364315 RepID=UPI0037163B16